MSQSEIDIRYTTLEELPYLRQWLKYEGMHHFFPASDGDELENFARIWIGFCRYSASLTAMVDGKPVGVATLYLMPYRKVAHHCLFQIIVDPEHQRKGVGFDLMRNLKHLAQNYFRLEILHAEVLDENPRMIGLLKKVGFTQFARQEKYVKEGDLYFPRILMECPLL